MNLRKAVVGVLVCLFSLPVVYGQIHEKEKEFYRISTVPVPENIAMEVGGLALMQDGSMAVATRRGDVWIVSNPSLERGTPPVIQLFAQGLHEPLGLAYLGGDLYTAQRGELTKLSDTNGDRVADVYETVYSWPVSGHYHEYSFGPLITPDTSFFVTGNVAFGNEEWWRGESRVPWRGWIFKITKDRELEPWATGVRSPAGYGFINGELFYTDNQGDWIGSGGLWHVPKGAFMGHPAGLRWSQREESPVKISEEEFYTHLDKRQVRVNGAYVKPENVMNEENPAFLYQKKEVIPELQLPAVILPHGILGISNSEIIVDETGGVFGPFEGQVFIGDQGQSKIMRVDLEKINGQYQGVAFDFRSGFQSGVMRLEWDRKGHLFVGETNRGWGSAGTKNSGLQFVTWTGKMPFEMQTVKAKPDGFEVSFTMPVDKKSAEDLDSYVGKSYIYKYHAAYGSPQTNIEEVKLKGVKVSEDGMSVRIVADNLRQYHLHEFALQGIKSREGGEPLLHNFFYYTLNNIPQGDKLGMSELSTFRSSLVKKPAPKTTRRARSSRNSVLSDDEIQPLLAKNTCLACHMKDQQLVGPSYAAVAKRKYSNERIVELIYNPEPKNWPEYATPMAPMPQVPKEEALKIAAWINAIDD
ncbi:MAG: hypothetical protein AAGA85_13420 [Bacteroidota bacterium]